MVQITLGIVLMSIYNSVSIKKTATLLLTLLMSSTACSFSLIEYGLCYERPCLWHMCAPLLREGISPRAVSIWTESKHFYGLN